MKRTTTPQAQQRRHWERTGQIMRCIGLIEYMQGADPGMPASVKAALRQASANLRYASSQEAMNNEFINLRLKPKWRRPQ